MGLKCSDVSHTRAHWEQDILSAAYRQAQQSLQYEGWEGHVSDEGREGHVTEGGACSQCSARFRRTCAQVALVLTPQKFYNYDLDTDIFNHSNLIYWQISLPGLDGWDNVSCTGTNFVVRAKAAAQARASGVCKGFPLDTTAGVATVMCKSYLFSPRTMHVALFEKLVMMQVNIHDGS